MNKAYGGIPRIRTGAHMSYGTGKMILLGCIGFLAFVGALFGLWAFIAIAVDDDVSVTQLEQVKSSVNGVEELVHDLSDVDASIQSSLANLRGVAKTHASKQELLDQKLRLDALQASVNSLFHGSNENFASGNLCEPLLRATVADSSNAIVRNHQNTSAPGDWRDILDVIDCYGDRFLDPNLVGLVETNKQWFHDQCEVELTVNPTNPDNMVATFIEGRRGTSAAATTGISYTFDGGKTWHRSRANESPCSGYIKNGSPIDNATRFASDPWVVFDPFGTAYHSALIDGPSPYRGFSLSKSLDGGVTWTQPTVMNPNTFAGGYTHDKQQLFADPFTPGRLFAVSNVVANNFIVMISEDYGNTWNDTFNTAFQAFPTFMAIPAKDVVILFVGDLVFTSSGFNAVLYYSRSTDGGKTFPSFIPLARGPLFQEEFTERRLAVGPYDIFNKPIDAKPSLRSCVTLPDSASNTKTGEVYLYTRHILSQNGTISEEYDLLFRSPDAGITWDKPIIIDPATSQYAKFLTQVTVLDSGRVVVAYYDSRNYDDSHPNNPWLFDVWAKMYNHDLTVDYGEIRITDKSMDMFQMLVSGSGFGNPSPSLMIGEYFGLQGTKSDSFMINYIKARNYNTPLELHTVERGVTITVHDPPPSLSALDPQAFRGSNTIFYMLERNHTDWTVTGELVKTPTPTSANCNTWPAMNLTGKIALIDSTSSSRLPCVKAAGAIAGINRERSDVLIGVQGGIPDLASTRILLSTFEALSTALDSQNLTITMTGDRFDWVSQTDRADIESVHVKNARKCYFLDRKQTVTYDVVLPATQSLSTQSNVQWAIDNDNEYE